jgi:hypothetical protein
MSPVGPTSGCDRKRSQPARARLKSMLLAIPFLVLAVSAINGQADVLGPLARAASHFGDQVARRPIAHKLLSLQQSGDYPTAIRDYIEVTQEALKEGYTSFNDVAIFVVLAGAECEYQLGATAKHPTALPYPR